MQPFEAGQPVEEIERRLGFPVVRLDGNENPLGPSPRAVAALRRLAGGAHRYPDGPGRALCRALAARLRLDPAQVVLGNGSTELIEILVRTYLGPDGNAVISEGSFLMYRIAVQAANGGLRVVPMRDHTHDLAAMADAVDERTRLVFVANPNNPTGTYVGRSAIDRLLSRLPEGALAVIDEAYREYVEGYEADYPDPLERLRAGGRIVVLRTFSKAYGLAGLRIGYALAPLEVASDLHRMRSPFNTSGAAQGAALAALEDRDHLQRTRRRNRRGLRELVEGLGQIGLHVIPSVASFVLVEGRLPAPEAQEHLVREGVLVRPLQAYGFPRGLRVSVGTSRDHRRALRAFRRVFA
jgi:histidinol-phosphate aminotransferase